MPKVTLTCPHCGGHFEYDFVWGASPSAIRLGTKRYMKCPLCSRWGTFDLRADRQPAGTLSPETPPTYSDRRLVVRRLSWILVPIAVILISLIWSTSYPNFVLGIDIVMLVVLLLVMGLLLATSRLPRTH
ncbi:MAG: hypothetical protein WAN74_02610 [Thermoplasmata archaeon]